MTKTFLYQYVLNVYFSSIKQTWLSDLTIIYAVFTLRPEFGLNYATLYLNYGGQHENEACAWDMMQPKKQGGKMIFFEEISC